MVSKYDNYWLSKINEIHEGILKAINTKKKIFIEINDIKQFGDRKFWYGFVELNLGGVVRRDASVHVKSLAKIILKQGFLHNFFRDNKNRIIRFEITDSLKLKIIIKEI